MEAISAARRALRDFIARESATRATVKHPMVGTKRAETHYADLFAMPEVFVEPAMETDPASEYFGQRFFMWGLDRLGVDTIIF